MSNESGSDDYMEMVKKQWAAMGIDPNTMMQYMNNAMEMQKNMQQNLESNPLVQNMMNMFGAANPTGDMLNLFDDSPEVKEDTDLQEEEIRAVLCSANIAFYSSLYTNTLSTYVPEEDLLEGLESAWGINNREELLDTLNWLETSGHRVYFDLIWEKLHTVPKAEWRSAIKSLELQALVMDNVEADRLKMYATHLLNGYAPLLAYGAFEGQKHPDITAWDLARAIYLCRCASDVEFFTREEALERIKHYAGILQSKYDSWSAFSNGYLIGFAMWNGEEEAIGERLEQNTTLLSHEKSLWKTMAFKL